MPRVKDAACLLREWTPSRCATVDDAPAELFDAHPLSEMMLSAEAEASISDSLVLIENHWRPEWHKNGVQVPINGVSSPKQKTRLVVYFIHNLLRKVEHLTAHEPICYDMRPEKLWHDDVDKRYDETAVTLMDKQNRQVPCYQIDNLDCAWISIVNEERECLGLPLIADWMLEMVMETLEHLTYVEMAKKVKELEAESLEFDENAKCDVCLSYEGEDGNELVFCDGCFLCVHQACYGIPTLPAGSWICRQCEAGVKSTTPCSLCPNTGGAMKMTEDGTRWCHISCALWVPEVGFGDVDLMEPVIRLDNIPEARRRLLCSICRSRYGAPIQCSKKRCKTAFHVTCAFQSNLVVRQELVDKDVHLVGLCQKHSWKDQKYPLARSPSKNVCNRGVITPTKSGNPPTGPVVDPDRKHAPVDMKQRLLDLEYNFHTLVTDKELQHWLSDKLRKGNLKSNKKTKTAIAQTSSIPDDVRSILSVYWRLKRRANLNQPLITPTPFHWRESATKAAETTKEAIAQAVRAAADLQAFEAFRRVRFGLDRARLVADMVLQREKRKCALFRRMWRIFELQMRVVLRKKTSSLSVAELAFFSTVHLGNSVYDNWNLFEMCKSNRTNVFTSGPGEDSNVVISTESKSQQHRPSVVEPETTSKSLGSEPSDNGMNVKQMTRGQSPRSVLYTIPYEHLIVPEDIRQRLRSALTFVSGSPGHKRFFLSTTPFIGNPSACKPINHGRRKYSPPAATRVESMCLKRGRKQLEHFDVNNDMSETVPVKRYKRLTLTPVSPTDCTLSSHTVPILSKFTVVKLNPDAVKAL